MDSEIKAHGLAQELTARQLQDTCLELQGVQDAENKSAISGDAQAIQAEKKPLCAQ